MKTCIDFDSLLTVAAPQLSEMQRVADKFPDAMMPGACEEFTKQVRAVEGWLRVTYSLTARIAKRTEDLEEIAEMWFRMNNFCDAAIKVIAGLKDRFPDCGTPELYNLVLDYKLASDVRRQEALEETECLTKTFPMGLFPERP